MSRALEGWTARSYGRGHLIVGRVYDGEPGGDGDWRYDDTGEPYDDSRPCARCGRMPTPEGYDACLGHIEGAIAACCGHGVAKPYVMMNENHPPRG